MPTTLKQQLWTMAGLVGCGLIPQLASAQGVIDGFTRGGGHVDVALSAANDRFDEFWFGTKKLTLAQASKGGFDEITRTSVSLFVAAGLRDDLDLILALPYITAKTNSTTVGTPVDQKAFQDLTLALKWKPWEGSLAVGKLSLLTALAVRTPVSAYDPNQINSIGHHSTDVDGRVLLQYELPVGLFGNVQSGYTVKSGKEPNGNVVPNSFPFSAKVGYFHDRLYLDAWFDLQKSGGSIDIGDLNSTLRTTSVDYQRIGGTVYVRALPSFGIALGAAQVIAGENADKGTTLSASLVYRLTLPGR